MTPRPLYRWKSFWFGVLVLAFLGWAWARALTHTEVILIKGVYVGQIGGRFIVDRESGSTLELPFKASSRPSRSPFKFGAPVLKGSDDGGWDWSFAHWFPILLFILAWIGWHAWRW